ncbi:hypothetical protein BZA70DRAFT_42626 [Myxozyma melibiosi]|uniref:Uncharacterized protein n=1 Tax=Myxozyma melibiosi TaxID=54550 RepID=A0ABR1FEN0_9ASCO
MESLEIADCMSPNESRGFIKDLLSLDAPMLIDIGEPDHAVRLEFDRQKHLKSLRSLKLEFNCDLTRDYRKALHFFGQLNVLHLNVLNFSDISPYIEEYFPNLVELRLVRQYSILSQKVQLKKTGTVSPSVHTNLKIFHFGGPTNFIDAFPYQADHGLVCIMQSELRDLIKSMPFLRELHLIGCMFDEYYELENSTMDEYEAQNIGLDLMNWTPELEVLNLDRSSIWPMPSIPATCVKLTCNGYTSPTPERVVRRSGRWYYHSTDRPVDDTRLNEFKRIKDLTLLSFPGGVESLLCCLARFQSLESLNLNENSEVIAWGDPVSEELANFLIYDCGFSTRVLSCSTSLECIGVMFPRLKKLSIAYNGMTNDSVLESLGKYFPNLQYLDLSSTMVSSHGITMYLWRDSIDHRPNFMSGYVLEDYIKKRLPSKHTQTLQTLVLTNCQAVDPRFYKFWKSVGAAIYTDEYVMYDSRKSRRLEQNR